MKETLSHSNAGKELGSANANELQPLPYQIYTHKFYDVEIVFKKNNVVYHFFPRKGQVQFAFNSRILGMLLEDAYVWTLGREISAKAQYYNSHEARFCARAEDPDRALGQPTFYVEFEDVATRLGAQQVLINKFLGRVDTLLERASYELFGCGERKLTETIKNSRWRH